jgi:hypothetical protein
MTIRCLYCHAILPPHVGLAAHYGTCTVLNNCLGSEWPVRRPYKVSEAEKAARANEQRGIILARARLKAEKHD